MDKEELIYDGYVKIYDVTKNNNGKIEKFTKVHLRGASAGIVINEEGKMALVTQYRPIIGVKTLEVPAGTLDKGISPKEIIIEELDEECGISKENIIDISDEPVLSYKIIENMSDGEMHIFLIHVKTMDTLPHEEDDVEEVKFYTLEEIEYLIKERVVTDPKTLKQIENKLNDLESTLKINTLYNKIKEISKNTTDKETKKELENLI